jgi:hypothetical protein
MHLHRHIDIARCRSNYRSAARIEVGSDLASWKELEGGGLRKTGGSEVGQVAETLFNYTPALVGRVRTMS